MKNFTVSEICYQISINNSFAINIYKKTFYGERKNTVFKQRYKGSLKNKKCINIVLLVI